jgi:transposase InsO family protein
LILQGQEPPTTRGRFNQSHGRPGTPTDQAQIQSFFSHLKGDWPHLTTIRDPGVLDAELARVRREYSTVRLHAAIG